MITVLLGLEVDVEISAFGIGRQEGGVLLGGHAERSGGSFAKSEYGLSRQPPRNQVLKPNI